MGGDNMVKAFNYVVDVKLVNKNYSLYSYKNFTSAWEKNYNAHTVKDNPKEIDTISIAKNDIMSVSFWTEKPLPVGREVQSLRRLSQEMAKTNPSFVIGKSHVLCSA